MSKQAFDKFINKTNGAKVREEIRQDKRKVKQELKARGEEMNRQNEDKYRTVTPSTSRKKDETEKSKGKSQKSKFSPEKKSRQDSSSRTPENGRRNAERVRSAGPKRSGAAEQRGTEKNNDFKAGKGRTSDAREQKSTEKYSDYRAKRKNTSETHAPKSAGRSNDFKADKGRSSDAREQRGSDRSSDFKAKRANASETRAPKGADRSNDFKAKRTAAPGNDTRSRDNQAEQPAKRARIPLKKADDEDYYDPIQKPAARQKSGSGKTSPASPKDPDAPMPLNKFVAHAGICARREAADLVKDGQVVVNGTKIFEPGFKVTANDKITVKGKEVHLQKNLVYILLNKPKDFITTAKDPQGRKTVLDLVKHATQERVYSVGRLDRNTTGVLLLTNDGELAQKLTHPSYEIKKIYEVKLDKPVTKKDLESIVEGITLEDGFIQADSVGYADVKDKSVVGIEIHSGRNRIVRRIFEHLGYEVNNLDRVLFANLTKKNVDRGKWRMLTEKEVRLLKYMNQSFVKNKEKKDASK